MLRVRTGAAFNSLRMFLWRLRASRTRHFLRIAEVVGLALLVCVCAYFLSWAAGTCMPLNEEWQNPHYGMRFKCVRDAHGCCLPARLLHFCVCCMCVTVAVAVILSLCDAGLLTCRLR